MDGIDKRVGLLERLASLSRMSGEKQMKVMNIVTNVAGLVGGAATAAIGAGMHLGHVAGTDFLHLFVAVSVAVIGWATCKPVVVAE